MSKSRQAVAAALTCCTVASLIGAAAAAAKPPSATGAGVAACASASTQVWFGLGEGGGTAGTIYYPLEFTNVGHSTCSFYGYPGVSAYGVNARPIGRPADRNRGPGTVATVVLAPGASAHAILGVHDAGAICSKSVNALGLKIYAPGQRSPQQVPFTFAACPSASVLTVEPLRPGVGIPGYTSS